MATLETKINQIRPRLSRIAPLTSYLCWCFVAINLLLGLGMYLLYNTPVPIAVASVLSYHQWGIVFGAIGVIMGYALIMNDWLLLRRMHIVGIFVKSTWLIALIVRCLAAPQTILITVIWTFLAAVQLGVYVYFFPPRSPGEGHSV